MLDFRGLDERQRRRKLRVGNESFVIQTFLVCIMVLLQMLPVPFFKGIFFAFTVLYLSVCYYWVRCTILDCAFPDKKRRRNRWIETVLALFLTAACIGCFLLDDGNPFVDEQGQASGGLFFAAITLSQWIMAIIHWVRKLQGYEE